MGEEAGTVASGVVSGLASSPLALTLVVINVLFLAGGLFVLHEIAETNRADKARRDALADRMAKVIESCLVTKPQQ